MSKLIPIIALATVLPIAAQAQWTTTPNILGAPQYGSTTRGPNGQVWTTTPNIMGSPGYGSTSRSNDGTVCTTTPNIMGSPQYGSTTTCR